MDRHLRIAVADDELDMRDYLQAILPCFGHLVVAVASTGRELVEKCRQERPDLVITDIKMPDMDGIAAASQICKDFPIPVILVSAYHDHDLVERRRGRPHPGVFGQADQAGRPGAGHRHRDPAVRAVPGSSSGGS